MIDHPDSIYVDGDPRSLLKPVVSSLGEKYVRSAPNDTEEDNLLKLPKR